MNNLTTKIGGLLGFSVIMSLLHLVSQYLFKQQDVWQDMLFQLLQIYFVQFVFSALLILVVYKVAKVSVNNVGYVFLGMLTLKTASTYFFFEKVMYLSEQSEVLKYHFVVVYLLFLMYDVYVTYTVLNPKKEE